VIYAALMIFGLAVPFAVGAWAGARFDAGVCVLICLALVGVLIGAPLLLLEVMPRNTFPWFEELFASIAIVSFLGSSVMVGEFTAGVFYGRKSRRPASLTMGFKE
jgi:hypothetical protein